MIEFSEFIRLMEDEAVEEVVKEETKKLEAEAIVSLSPDGTWHSPKTLPPIEEEDEADLLCEGTPRKFKSFKKASFKMINSLETVEENTSSDSKAETTVGEDSYPRMLHADARKNEDFELQKVTLRVESTDLGVSKTGNEVTDSNAVTLKVE